MSSEKQIAANRRNAQKSTGPRTEEGKARSRRNAYRHGMTASVESLPPEDLALFQDRLAGWVKDTRAEGELQHYLVATAVVATVRMDRCARLEFAEVARRRRRAKAAWQGHQTRKVNALVEDLNDDPAGAVAGLEQFAKGCGWLIDAWEDLEIALEEQGRLEADEGDRLLRLTGRDPADHDPDDAEGLHLRLACLATRPLEAAAEAAELLGIDRAETPADADVLRLLPDLATAVGTLLCVIRARLEELERQWHHVWHNTDAPALSEAIDLVSFDDSKQAPLRHRYEGANHLAMHRALNQLVNVRKERRRTAGDPPPGWSGRPVQTCTTGPWQQVAPAPEPEPEPEPEPGPEPEPVPAPTQPQASEPPAAELRSEASCSSGTAHPDAGCVESDEASFKSELAQAHGDPPAPGPVGDPYLHHPLPPPAPPGLF